MNYLLDSDVFIDYLWLDPAETVQVESLVPAGIAISIVTHMEAYQSTFRKPDVVNAQREFSIITATLPILAVDEPIAGRCALIRHDLQMRGRRVRQRALDLMIAATALEHDLTLVTRNQADYRDIPEWKLT